MMMVVMMMVIMMTMMQDVDLGSHLVIQTLNNSLYAVFQFPPSAPLPAGEELTIHSGSAGTGPCKHEPRNHYFFTSQPRWGSGPNCITLLTRPDDKVQYTEFNLSSSALTQR